MQYQTSKIKTTIGIFLGALLLLFCMYLTFVHKKEFAILKDDSMQEITIGSTKLLVEVVSTPQKIQQGLSGRASLGSDGMLFVLGTRRIPTFWMKEMLFPLDFIWIDGTTVVGITEQVPPPPQGTSIDSLRLYSPTVPVTHVLEVQAGFVAEKKVALGQEVILPVAHSMVSW